MQAGLAARIQGWARFRNVLVHLYLDIDHKRTHAVIQTKLVERVPGLGKRPAALTPVPRLDLLRIVERRRANS
jgi:hypothetical protein